jgi:hypothetical protein
MRDVHLMPAARFTVGMILTPIWWMVVLWVLIVRIGSWPWLVFLILLWPVSLWLWSRVWHWAQ